MIEAAEGIVTEDSSKMVITKAINNLVKYTENVNTNASLKTLNGNHPVIAESNMSQHSNEYSFEEKSAKLYK